MYNSVLINILFKIWSIIEEGYQGSILKNIVDRFKKIMKYLFTGSVVKDIFSKDYNLLDNSILNTIYLKLIGLYEIIIGSINKFIRKNMKESIIKKDVKNLFGSLNNIVRSFSVFTISFGLTVILINLKNNTNWGPTYSISIFLFIFGLFIFMISSNFEKYIKNSKITQFILTFFRIDEGEEQWW